MGMRENSTSERKRHTISLLITGVGIILFWRGIWELSQKAFSSEISLMVGFSILISVAIIERKQLFKFFHV
jgi:hypothetical protein